jgi:8-oxo-dGTP pyrophosphatase MutT (NUDIX family)
LARDTRDSVEGKSDVSPALPSASVVLVRRAEAGFEVFMVRRGASASAFADVYVFPGGTVRKDDYQDQPGDDGFTPAEALRQLSIRGGTPPEDATQAIALWRAAARELFEEAGVLLARDATGEIVQISEDDTARYAEFRRALQSESTTLAQVLASERLTLHYRALRYFSHWITPLHVRRRFDTRFFVAEMPEGQTALHCQVETTEGLWIRPDEALSRADQGRFGIVFPTRKHLERLTQHRNLDAFLAFAAQKPIRTIQPALAGDGGNEPVLRPAEVAECW